MATIEQLLVRIDASTEQLRREMRRAEQSVSGGAGNIDRAMKQVDRAFDRTAVRAAANANRISASTAQYRNFGGVAQQAGFQVADFATQVAAGQSAMLAFTQQGSQLLGFFGPWGAVLGAATAVAGGLYLALRRGADDTDAATAATVSYQEALEKANEYLETAEANQRRLAEERRKDTIETLRQALATERLTQARLDEAQARAQGVVDRLEDAAARSGVDTNPGLERARATLEGLGEIASATDARIADLLSQLQQVEAAPIGGGRAEGVDAIGGAADRAGKEVRTLADILADMNVQADRLADQGATEALELITRTLESAQTPAERYAAHVAEVEAALGTVQARAAQLRAMGEGGRAGALEAAIGDPAAVRDALAKLDPALKQVERQTRNVTSDMERLFQTTLDRISGSASELPPEVANDPETLSIFKEAIA